MNTDRHHMVGRLLPAVCVTAIVVIFCSILAGCSHSTVDPPDPPAFTVAANDVQPALGQYFFLSDPDSAAIPTLVPSSLRVYLDDSYALNDTELGAQEAEVWIDPAGRTPEGRPYQGAFHFLMLGVDYWWPFELGDHAQPVLWLRDPLPGDHALAVAYRQVLANGDTVAVGSSHPTSEWPIQLKMLRPREDAWGHSDLTRSPWAPVRRLELRNVYDLGATNIDPEGFLLRVVRDLGDGGPSDLVNEFGVSTPLIEVLGLDQCDNDDHSSREPDGKVDPKFMNFDRGLLWFPDLRPFDPSLTDIKGNELRPRSWPPLGDGARPDTLGWTLANGLPTRASIDVRADETVPEIYDLRPDKLSTDGSEYHEYTIEVSFGN